MGIDERYADLDLGVFQESILALVEVVNDLIGRPQPRHPLEPSIDDFDHRILQRREEV
jgi:hypothetical protein